MSGDIWGVESALKPLRTGLVLAFLCVGASLVGCADTRPDGPERKQETGTEQAAVPQDPDAPSFKETALPTASPAVVTPPAATPASGVSPAPVPAQAAHQQAVPAPAVSAVDAALAEAAALTAPAPVPASAPVQTQSGGAGQTQPPVAAARQSSKPTHAPASAKPVVTVPPAMPVTPVSPVPAVAAAPAVQPVVQPVVPAGQPVAPVAQAGVPQPSAAFGHTTPVVPATTVVPAPVAQTARPAPAQTPPPAPVAQTARPAPAQTPPPAPRSEQAAYKAALGAYEARHFEQSEKAFDAFIRDYPQSKLLPNALYWKGECLYSRGRYPEAIFVFKDVISRFPTHAKAADALLKAGMSYERMKDMDNAKLHYRVLAEDYPAAQATATARRLGLLKE